LGENEALLAQFEEHLVRMQLSPLTVVNYVADLRTFVRWGVGCLGPGFALAALGSDTIRAYRSHLLEEKQSAAATVNRRLQTLRKFCAFGVQAGLMAANPADGIELVPNEGSAAAAPLNGQQVAGLLRAAASEQPSLARRDTAILMLLLYGGLRLNELVELHLDDVQFDYPGTHLVVTHRSPSGKGGRPGEVRKVPLEGEVRHALCEYLAVRPNLEGVGHLFLSREGRPLSARSVQRMVNVRARAAGLEGLSPQALRHVYINLIGGLPWK
jgi:site-specific recombinase XerC